MQDKTSPRFLVLDMVIGAIETVRPLIAAVRKHDRDLAEQIRRAMSSVALNLAEGNGTDAGNRRMRFLTAAGSNAEVRAGLRVAVAWGYIGTTDVAPVDTQLDSVAAILYRLTH